MNLINLFKKIYSNAVPLEVSECILGTQGRLPCNVTPPIINDKVILVIWYKDGLSTPIYRYEFMNTNIPGPLSIASNLENLFQYPI